MPVTSPETRRRGRTRVRRYRRGALEPGELGSFDTAFRDGLLSQLGLNARRLEQLSANQNAFNAQLLAGSRAVARRLNEAGANDQAINEQAFFLVASLLGQWGEPLPDRLQRALFRFAATLDGIEVDDNFADERGNRALALTLGGARIVLHPSSYRLLATSYSVDGAETTIATLRTALVNRQRERPAQ
jgi:hypothetical protein